MSKDRAKVTMASSLFYRFRCLPQLVRNCWLTDVAPAYKPRGNFSVATQNTGSRLRNTEVRPYSDRCCHGKI